MASCLSYGVIYADRKSKRSARGDRVSRPCMPIYLLVYSFSYHRECVFRCHFRFIQISRQENNIARKCTHPHATATRCLGMGLPARRLSCSHRVLFSQVPEGAGERYARSDVVEGRLAKRSGASVCDRNDAQNTSRRSHD